MIKQIIWVSILLAMSAIIMPMLFHNGNTGTKKAEIQSQAPPETSVKSYVKTPDTKIGFTVLENGQAKQEKMSDYLPGVLAAEMPVTFSGEALKAQAVAARTYILYCTAHVNPKHPQANICTDPGCCLAHSGETELRGEWGDKYDENIAVIRKAVSDTDGEILTYAENPILASFHSSSAGKTEAGKELWGDVPYLVSVDSPETANDVPDYVTTVEVSKDNFRETIKSYKPEAAFSDDASGWVGKSEMDGSGRVKSVTVGGTELSGTEMRKLFSLRSTAFRLEYKDKRFLFTVTGYGHGLGMSQYGANVMAKDGFDYKEILSHYYPETELS